MALHVRCRNLAEFQTWLSSEPNRIEWFLDRLAINVTELFRNPEKWREMETEILPKLLGSTRRLKMWSAGCSYGAEPYTLAAILDQNFPGQHRIVATDIDTAALNQARRGEFSEQDGRAIPERYRPRFRSQAPGKLIADRALTRYLDFRNHNLFDAPVESCFDLVVCRNVVIYFTEAAKDELYRKFFRSLRPGGILFVGSTERIPHARQIGFETAQPFYYRKPMQDHLSCRNVS